MPQLTLVVKNDIYLFVSGSELNNPDTSMLQEGISVGRIMHLSGILVDGFKRKQDMYMKNLKIFVTSSRK